MRSSRRLQQMQPLLSSTRRASDFRMAPASRSSDASMLTAAMSFTMTATCEGWNVFCSKERLSVTRPQESATSRTRVYGACKCSALLADLRPHGRGLVPTLLPALEII